MIVTSIEAHTKTKVKVCLDNRTDFQLYKKEIKKYNIEVDKELENYDEILRETLIPRAKKRTLHLLEKMDRTDKEIRGKLAKNGYPIEAIDAAIQYAASYNYINDERYALSYVRNYRDYRSKNRILQDLYHKGIDKELICNALDMEYTTDEKELVLMYIRKRNYNPENATEKEKSKMYRFLMGKGFSYDTISKYL